MSAALLADITLALALLPAALAAWNLMLFRAPRPAGAAALPPVSVLIPARDEEAQIAGAVGSVLASKGVAFEVVVLDDASTDRTAAIVRDLAAAEPRLRLETAPPLPPGWSGKQHACAVLAGLARHPLLVFMDADVRLTRPDALARLAGFLAARPAVGLASGFPRQEMGSLPERLLIPLISFLLLGYLPMIGLRHTRWAMFGAGNGQLFVARADAYRAAGGHALIRRSLHDGIALPRAFRAHGVATDLFDATDLAVCRMYRGGRQLWAGFSKNATEGMARPVALPVWTVLLFGGSVLPFVLLAAGAVLGWPAAVLRPAAVAAGLALALRLGLALRFGQPVGSALLHPLGVLVMLVLQWTALVRAARGHAPHWRGRSYLPP